MEKQFETPLGFIRCGIKSNSFDSLIEKKIYTNGNSEIFKTAGHKIEMISFKLQLPLYNGETITDSSCWIFRIEKISDINESIETYCLLDKLSNSIEFDSATGENLDAIQANNQDWTLHIGTEDGEILNARAERNDWFPSRLKNKVDCFKTISKMKPNGFNTKIPDLNKNEKIHIQYLTAYDKRDLNKLNTWFAVDEFKIKLENWVGL